MSLNEILIINKPQGITSHDVVDRVRTLYPKEKVGHAGTLDPLATGILIILIGNATKRQAEFMGQEKEYVTEMTLGIETDTYDSDGAILAEKPNNLLMKINRGEIEEILPLFTGEIAQTVPPYSAVKIRGKKLYEHARANTITPDMLPTRTVTIKELSLLEFQPGSATQKPRAKLLIVCSKGTYIRSLVHDIGIKLGCGAMIISLTRTRIGLMKLDNALTLEDMRKKGISNPLTDAEKGI